MAALRVIGQWLGSSRRIIAGRHETFAGEGGVERLQDFMEKSFEPGRCFANELEFQLQLDAWFDTRANPRVHKTLRCRLIDRLVEERTVLLRVLAQILDEAVEDGRLAANDTRRKRMRVRVPKPIRTWLQPDERSDLLAAVSLVDAGGYSPITERVNELRDRGEPLPRIAAEVGLSVQTVYNHLAKPAPDIEQLGEGRALLTLLSYGGLRSPIRDDRPAPGRASGRRCQERPAVGARWEAPGRR